LDDRRIDAIARLLGTIQTRRGTMRDALAGVVLLALTASPDVAEAWRHKKKHKKRKKRRRRRCPGGQTRCFGACTNTSADPRNCGVCGRDCDNGAVCRGGDCVDAGCAAGLTRCNGVCVNLTTDAANCGRCGRVCAAGEACRNGVCGCDVCAEGNCPFSSVQAAIDAAVPGSIITVCQGAYTGNLVIDKPITLLGAGADEVILEGEGGATGGSVVTVLKSITATIRGVRITGGFGTFVEDRERLEGGGVFNQGILTLIDVEVTGNQAELGGGILNDSSSDLILDHTVVTNNLGVSANPQLATVGGGMLNLFGADLKIMNGSVISGNRAETSGGFHNNGTLELIDSIVRGNTADGNGGGFINDAGGFLTANNSLIQFNQSGRNGAGGLISNGLVVLENGTVISRNSAGANAGGIFMQTVGRLESTASAIRDNDAREDGGGIFSNGGTVTLMQTAVTGNEATGNGGGVHNQNTGTLTLEATIISDNTAGDTGGGIFNDDGTVTLDAQSAVVDNDPDNCVGTDACPA
jgi:hypothetical protein